MRALLAAAVLVATAATARAEPARRLRVGVDGVLPFSAWDRVAGPGLGGSLAAGVARAPGLEVTARVAVIAHAGATTDGVTAHLLEAPVVGGARYVLATHGRARGFALGEVGVIATRTTVTIGDVSDHQSRLDLAGAIGAGASYRGVDLTVAAWLADLGDLDHGVGVTASVAVEVARW